MTKIHKMSVIKKRRDLFFGLTFCTMLLTASILFQYLYDTNKSKKTKPSPMVLPYEVVKAADLGLHSATSDLVWLASIQYFGDWQSDNYQMFDDFINLCNNLDPKFSYPYAFGVLFLPSLDMVDEAIEVGKRGIAESSPDWRIPYYLAVTYHSDKKDPANATKYFDIAANTAGAPDGIKRVAAIYGSKPDIRSQTILIWESIFENTNDEIVKERAKKYIIHFEILNILEKAAKIYHNQFDSYPDPIEKLVETNILIEIPKDPLGFEYYIDEEGRARPKKEK